MNPIEYPDPPFLDTVLSYLNQHNHQGCLKGLYQLLKKIRKDRTSQATIFRIQNHIDCKLSQFIPTEHNLPLRKSLLECRAWLSLNFLTDEDTRIADDHKMYVVKNVMMVVQSRRKFLRENKPIY
jgi:hypothetical protein